MNIAICDNNVTTLVHLGSLLTTYSKQCNQPLRYYSFENGDDLLASMKIRHYDVLLLAILMPGFRGIEIAREIRQFDSLLKIIFLSTTSQYALDSYTVGAYNYLIKPASSETLFPILDTIFTNMVPSNRSFLINTKSSILRLDYKQITYVEVLHQKVYFHLSNGATYYVSGTLSRFEPDFLKQPDFIKVHRSYLVNMEYIQELGKSSLTTYRGATIPVSRRSLTAVTDAYRNYLSI